MSNACKIFSNPVRYQCLVSFFCSFFPSPSLSLPHYSSSSHLFGLTHSPFPLTVLAFISDINLHIPYVCVLFSETTLDLLTTLSPTKRKFLFSMEFVTDICIRWKSSYENLVLSRLCPIFSFISIFLSFGLKLDNRENIYTSKNIYILLGKLYVYCT